MKMLASLVAAAALIAPFAMAEDPAPAPAPAAPETPAPAPEKPAQIIIVGEDAPAAAPETAPEAKPAAPANEDAPKVEEPKKDCPDCPKCPKKD